MPEASEQGIPFAEYWNPPTDFYGEPVYSGTLRVIYEDPLEHGNSWGAYTGATTRARSATMNKLVDLNPYNSGQIIPDLASGWEHHEDASGITLHFPENVQWHNGEPFACEDARFSMETMVTGNGLTTPEMMAKLGFIQPASLTCEDDSTLTMRFQGPNATALDAFTDRAAYVFNKAWFEENGEQAMFNDWTVGTGPFVSVDHSEEEAQYEKNPDYFKGDGALPYLDGVIIYGIVDESRQQASMLAHQGDFHWIRNWGQYDAYVEHDKIQTVLGPTRGHHTIWLKKANAPFDNLRVRQAIFMGMDREAAVDVLLEGHGSLGFVMPPNSPWSVDPALGCEVPAWCPPEEGMEAQRAEARAILEEEGFDFNKTYLVTVESDAQVQARATFIQEQLRLIGVQTEFDLVETVAWRQQTYDGTWGDILPRNDTMPSGDPALGMSYYYRCNSSGNHWTPGTECDPQAEELLDRLATTVDQQEREALADEFQLYAMEQYWRFPLYWEQEGVAFWPEVRGYVHHPAPNTSFLKWEHIWIDPAHRDDTGFSGQTTGIPGGI